MKTRNVWKRKLNQVLNQGIEDLPPLKIFKPTQNLIKLEDYSKEPHSSYWENFPKNSQDKGESLIDGKALKDLALQYGYENKEELDKIVGWMKKGQN